MRRFAARLGAAAVVAIELLATPAHAYVRTCRESDGQPLVLREPKLVFRLARRSIPAGLSVRAVEAEIEAAFAAWDRRSNPATALTLVLDSVDGDGRSVRDGVNSIVFRQQVWSKDGVRSPLSGYSHDALAQTSAYESRSAGASAANIVEADIELNALDYHWATAAAIDRRGPTKDLRLALMHEVGHALGLEHNCDDAPFVPRAPARKLPRCASASAELRAATMFPSWLEGSALRDAISADERRAVADVYPLAATPRAAPAAFGEAQSKPRWLGWLSLSVLACAALVVIRYARAEP